MTDSQGSKQRKSMEVVGWFYLTQIALFAYKFIVKSTFVVDYLQHSEVLEF